MITIEIFNNFPEIEMDLMIAVYKVFGEKITWEILKVLYLHKEGLTQKDFQKLIPYRKAFSRILREMEIIGLIIGKRNYASTNRQIIYYLNDANCKDYIKNIQEAAYYIFKRRYNSSDEDIINLLPNYKCKQNIK